MFSTELTMSYKAVNIHVLIRPNSIVGWCQCSCFNRTHPEMQSVFMFSTELTASSHVASICVPIRNNIIRCSQWSSPHQSSQDHQMQMSMSSSALMTSSDIVHIHVLIRTQVSDTDKRAARGGSLSIWFSGTGPWKHKQSASFIQVTNNIMDSTATGYKLWPRATCLVLHGAHGGGGVGGGLHARGKGYLSDRLHCSLKFCFMVNMSIVYTYWKEIIRKATSVFKILNSLSTRKSNNTVICLFQYVWYYAKITLID